MAGRPHARFTFNMDDICDGTSYTTCSRLRTYQGRQIVPSNLNKEEVIMFHDALPDNLEIYAEYLSRTSHAIAESSGNLAALLEREDLLPDDFLDREVAFRNHTLYPPRASGHTRQARNSRAAGTSGTYVSDQHHQYPSHFPSFIEQSNEQSGSNPGHEDISRNSGGSARNQTRGRQIVPSSATRHDLNSLAMPLGYLDQPIHYLLSSQADFLTGIQSPVAVSRPLMYSTSHPSTSPAPRRGTQPSEPTSNCSKRILSPSPDDGSLTTKRRKLDGSRERRSGISIHELIKDQKQTTSIGIPQVTKDLTPEEQTLSIQLQLVKSLLTGLPIVHESEASPSSSPDTLNHNEPVIRTTEQKLYDLSKAPQFENTDILSVAQLVDDQTSASTTTRPLEDFPTASTSRSQRSSDLEHDTHSAPFTQDQESSGEMFPWKNTNYRQPYIGRVQVEYNPWAQGVIAAIQQNFKSSPLNLDTSDCLPVAPELDLDLTPSEPEIFQASRVRWADLNPIDENDMLNRRSPPFWPQPQQALEFERRAEVITPPVVPGSMRWSRTLVHVDDDSYVFERELEAEEDDERWFNTVASFEQPAATGPTLTLRPRRHSLESGHTELLDEQLPSPIDTNNSAVALSHNEPMTGDVGLPGTVNTETFFQLLGSDSLTRYFGSPHGNSSALNNSPNIWRLDANYGDAGQAAIADLQRQFTRLPVTTLPRIEATVTVTQVDSVDSWGDVYNLETDAQSHPSSNQVSSPNRRRRRRRFRPYNPANHRSRNNHFRPDSVALPPPPPYQPSNLERATHRVQADEHLQITGAHVWTGQGQFPSPTQEFPGYDFGTGEVTEGHWIDDTFVEAFWGTEVGGVQDGVLVDGEFVSNEILPGDAVEEVQEDIDMNQEVKGTAILPSLTTMVAARIAETWDRRDSNNRVLVDGRMPVSPPPPRQREPESRLSRLARWARNIRRHLRILKTRRSI